MSVYLDTSAIVKLLIQENESDDLRTYLAQSVTTSAIAETELRRFALRDSIPQSRVTVVLDQFEIIDIDRSVFAEAGLLPGRFLRSLDALHLTIALRHGADEFVTYDRQQAGAARELGLRVATPGAVN